MLRAMLRGLLTHKLRLALSALAVVLGTMFMTGAFVGGDTIAKGFENLFATTQEDLDVQVTAVSDAPRSQTGTSTPTAFVDPSALAKIEAVPGVAKATGLVLVDGARVIGPDGKVVPSTGPPRYGSSWVDDGSGFVVLREGRAPVQPDEVAVNATLADAADLTVGGTVKVLTLRPEPETFQVVGIFGYEGDRDSLGGETNVAFTLPTAQRVMIDAPGKFTQVDVTATPGVTPTALRDDIAAALGPGYAVKTADEVAEEQADAMQGFVGILKNGLAVFAFIGLFTGTFLIFNTFAMLVAQRTRELALYRAFGAGRGQVLRGVLAEAALLGLAASLVGLVLGAGVGYLLTAALEALANTSLPVTGVILRPYVVIATLAVGVGVTVLAALVPALRAGRVAPVAAMRESAAPERPLGPLTIAGAVVLLAGAGLLTLRLTGAVEGQNVLLLGGGTLLAFLGVAMLAPAISRPVTTTLGRPVSFTTPGRLGARNTGRNPIRTAVTAAALMIGVALATGAGVFASSAKAGISDAFRAELTAQLVIAGDLTTGQGGFDPALISRITELPEVTDALALQVDTVRLGQGTAVVAATDVGAAQVIFSLRATAGELRTLRAGEYVIDADTAARDNLTVGSTTTMVPPRGGTFPLRLVGIYETSRLVSGPLISTADAAGFRTRVAQQGYVRVADDAAVPTVKDELTALFAANPEITVADASSVVDQAQQFLDVILAILNVLLGLTIVVAVLGVINTLLLSIYERTREIGLIRAVGMSRGQVARMIGVESVLISVFGALLGLVVGVALGTAIVVALDSSGYLSLTLPWGYLVAVLVLAVVAGVVAAILPAIRAARLDVLRAIAYE
ncbi:ABC transporter permease [Luedemannella helvata]|uniref:ABC transporter permease n=1 Tax=Luedemannella helvata TaxID=349315 RepID=A0ABP4WBC4_9ACTN